MTPKSVDELLRDVRLMSEDRYQSVEAVRSMVKTKFKPVAEEVKYGGIRFSSGVQFCGVFAYSGHVSVEFGHGAAIKDSQLLPGVSMISLDFLVTSLVVVLIPGTGVLYTVSTGIVQGRKASIYAAVGCTTGIVPHLLATVLGLAAVMHTSALAFQILKYSGVAYLFYVAYATWRDKSAFAVNTTLSKTSVKSVVVKAFLLNILNPKLTIFFLAFLPQFVEPTADHPLFQLLLLSAVFMAMTFVVFVVYGFVAHAFRRLVIESARVQSWLRYGFAAAFAGLGAKLALTEK